MYLRGRGCVCTHLAHLVCVQHWIYVHCTASKAEKSGVQQRITTKYWRFNFHVSV